MAEILIADDSEELLALATRIVESAGHQAITAPDGSIALAMAREHVPDLAILDVSMPGMAGFEVCRALRADAITARIPVILLSGWGFPTDLEAGINAGARAYIVKPFQPKQLLERVEALLPQPTRDGPGRGSSTLG